MTVKPLINKASAAKKAADVLAENTRIAKILYENHNDTRYNKTTGRFEDSVGTPISPQEYLKDQKNLHNAVNALAPTAKDGLGNNVRDYIYNPAENKFEHKDKLVHESPLPVGMPRELKFGSAAHRRKYPSQYKTINELEDLKKFQNGTYKEPTVGTAAHRRKYPARYGHNYTSKLDQAAYPKVGTAPSEKRVITDAAIQKRLDKARGPSDWEMIYEGMSPIEKGQWNAEKRKQGLNGKTAEPLVKEFRNDSPDTYLSHPDQQKGMLLATLEDAKPKPKPKPKKINTYPEVLLASMPVRDSNHEAREAAQEKLREYAFSSTPDPDAVRGIGSFKDVIGRKLRANNSKRDWEKRNQVVYKNNPEEE